MKRNASRFPGDFMFVLARKEFVILRSQFVTSKADRLGLRHAPMAEELLGYDRERCFGNLFAASVRSFR